MINQINYICSKLEEQMIMASTTEKLSVASARFISILAYTAGQIGQEAKNCTDRESMPWLISFFPILRFKLRYVTINTKASASSTKQLNVGMNGYNDRLRMFHNTFDVSKLGYKRYTYIHRHYAHHLGYILCSILILTRSTSLNDLQ